MAKNRESARPSGNETGRPLGERFQNPQAEVSMREVDMVDWSEADGAHVFNKMGMGRNTPK